MNPTTSTSTIHDSSAHSDRSRCCRVGENQAEMGVTFTRWWWLPTYSLQQTPTYSHIPRTIQRMQRMRGWFNSGSMHHHHHHDHHHLQQLHQRLRVAAVGAVSGW